MLGSGAFSAILVAVSFNPWFWVGFALFALLGFSGLIFSNAANTMLQLLSPDYLRGRLMSLYTLLFAGMTPFGALVTGYLASALGIRRTLAIEGAVCATAVVVASAYGWLLGHSASRSQLSRPAGGADLGSALPVPAPRGLDQLT